MRFIGAGERFEGINLEVFRRTIIPRRVGGRKMDLTKEQMLTILDMYVVCRIEGQVTQEITELICEVSFALDQLGFDICDSCHDVLNDLDEDNVETLPDGTIMVLCDLCKKEDFIVFDE